MILVLDSDVPYIPTQVMPRADATIVQIDLDPVKERIPLWSFPLTCRSAPTRSRAWSSWPGYAAEPAHRRHQATHRDRRAELSAPAQRATRGTQGNARGDAETRPITAEWLGYCIGQLQREAPDCVFVDESLTSHVAVWNHLDTDEPETMFGSGGSSLGWGLGAALGIKLARPDRPVVLSSGWIVHLR